MEEQKLKLEKMTKLNKILNNIEVDLTGMIYSGHKLNAHHITSVIDKYRDEEIEDDEWDWEDEEQADIFQIMTDDDDED